MLLDIIIGFLLIMFVICVTIQFGYILGRIKEPKKLERQLREVKDLTDTVSLIINLPVDVYERIIKDEYEGQATQATDDINALLDALDDGYRVANKCKICAYYRGN